MASKMELFLKLAQPDSNGKSRWVNINEFIGDFSELKFGNGASWARKESSLAKKYNILFDKTQTSGNGIDRIKLDGYNDGDIGSQYIRKDIKDKIKVERCVVLGTAFPEVDHKNGMKNEGRVMKNENQDISDFQPLNKAANDAKRQYCKECRKTGLRFDAKLLGYPMSFYSGVQAHTGKENDCIGCYWYDPLEFKRHLKQK